MLNNSTTTTENPLRFKGQIKHSIDKKYNKRNKKGFQKRNRPKEKLANIHDVKTSRQNMKRPPIESRKSSTMLKLEDTIRINQQKSANHFTMLKLQDTIGINE